MSDVTVHHEVAGRPTAIGWRLCLQWVTYNYEDGSPAEDGYRFIWRRADGTLQPARGQARIPALADILELLALAARNGWLGTVEPGI